ncbi:MAG: alpha/beta hydrolase-fold protein [Candidatus Lokiarchaeia archaeon]
MSKSSKNSKIRSPMISKLQDDIQINKEEAVSKFWKEIEKLGTPIFEEIEGDDKYNLITFLVREDEEVENIVCNNFFVTEDIREGLLERIEDTNVYFKSYKILKGIRETYCLSKNNPLEPKDPTENIFKYGNLVFPDPFNSTFQQYKVDGLQFPLNEFESPDAPPQPYYGERSNIDSGKVEEFTSNSEVLNNKRKILVYTPPNYSKNHIPYHFLLLFDGILFEEAAKVSSTLDNLIADEKIPPIIAIMVENFIPTNIALRASELPPNPKFSKYIITELLPWGHENFNITIDPSQSVIAGASYGGIASAFIAFKHPEIFTNILSMSGAYSWYPGADFWLQSIKDIDNFEHWWTKEEEKEVEWLVRQFAQSKKLPLKFYLDVGVLEEADPTNLFIANHHFRNVLNTKGYPVSYVEYLGGHDFVCWRGSIADGLIYLIGK